MAYVVMINASGTNPQKYVRGISGIMAKVKSPEKVDTEDETTKKNLQEYSGFYSEQPWWSEVYISTWQEKLVALNLPSNSPAESMTFYKYIEKDTFQRIRDDGKLGEKLIFERDENGKIVRFKSHGNYSPKINR